MSRSHSCILSGRVIGLVSRVIKWVLVIVALLLFVGYVDSWLWADGRIGRRTAKELAAWLESGAPDKPESRFQFYDAREAWRGILCASHLEVRLLEVEYGQMEFEVVADNARYWISYMSRDRTVWILRRVSKRPNKSLQPTATAVTPPAAQEIVPAVAVAEH
jgi:hypothetical protein